jgi:DtxR family Mn-dependent transcriptional regulator
MTTPAVEDYLKAIYDLSREGKPVSTSAIAERLGVASASVTGMLKRLADQGLVDHVRYRGSRLTAYGLGNAIRTIRRHRVIELFLVNVLGYGWDEVHQEAERLEHAASEGLIDRMAAVLGEPDADPHGAPIPTAAGVLTESDYPSLAQLGANRPATLRRVQDEDPALLRRLAGLNLRPGARVEILEEASADRPFTLRVDDEVHSVPRKLAATLEVEPIEPGS